MQFAVNAYYTTSLLTMTKQKQIDILLVFLACLVLAGIGFFIYITFADIIRQSDQILANKNKLQSLGEETAQLEKFKKSYSGYKPDLEKIDALFIDAANPVEFIKFLENTAARSGVAVKINFSPKKKTGAQFDIFQVTAKGEFPGIMVFIQKLEKGPYLIRTQTLSMVRSEPDFSSGVPVATKVNLSMLIQAVEK